MDTITTIYSLNMYLMSVPHEITRISMNSCIKFNNDYFMEIIISITYRSFQIITINIRSFVVVVVFFIENNIKSVHKRTSLVYSYKCKRRVQISFAKYLYENVHKMVPDSMCCRLEGELAARLNGVSHLTF